jgi:hypothetical protein
MHQSLRSLRFLLVGLFCLLTSVGPSLGSTVAPPYNLGEMARISRMVVLAEAQGSRAELRGDIPYTVTRFKVIENVAGESFRTSLDVEAKGGVVGDVGYKVPGNPVFAEGARYLLFLDPAPGGAWRPKMASYGILREEEGTGLLRPVAEAEALELVPRSGVEPVEVYSRAALLPHLAAVAGGAPWHRDAVVVSAASDATAGATADATAADPRNHTAPAACQLLTSGDGFPMRWFGFETGGSISVWHTTPGQPGIADGGASAVEGGTKAWTDHNASAIKMLYAGSKPSTHDCTDGAADVNGEVTFNDPCNQLPALGTCAGTLPPGWTSATCCGQVAEYGYFFNATSTVPFDGETWRQLTGHTLVVNDGAQCLGETDFKEMVTHYLGHGLGFNHHTDPDATMYVNLAVHPPRGAAISTTDKACASYSYHSFIDVPYNYFAWKFIEAVKNAGVTSGCGSGSYCPDNVVTRNQMAVFLLVAKEGASYVPPPCTTPTFSDVPCSNPFAPWIEELVQRGVTAGCGGSSYCPGNEVTRNQMAVFLIKTLEGNAYTPPPCTVQNFDDVPCSSPFAPWVQEMVDRGLTAGCGGGNFCPNTPVTRAQMAVFLTTNFSLPLP